MIGALVACGVLLVVGVVVVALVVVAALRPSSESTSEPPVTRSDPGSGSGTAADGADPGDPWGIALGPLDAEREVIVYEDLLCPPCATFADVAGVELRERAEAGEIRLIVRPVGYLVQYGDYTEQAMNALFVVRDAAGDGAAFRLNEILLEDQPAETGPFPETEDLVDAAVEAGADEDDVREGIELETESDLVDDLTRRAIDREGITSVPLVLLDGERFEEGTESDQLARRLLAALD